MWLALLGVGLGVGLIGALVGSGGGFILVPLLLLVFGMKSYHAAGTSLAMIVAVGLSGAISFHRQGRVDYLSAFYFIIASIPGAVLGGLASPYLPVRWFDVAFGVMLALVALRMIWPRRSKADPNAEGAAGEDEARPARFTISRVLVSGKDTFRYSYNLPLALAISFASGFLSAVLGVGGGIVRTPLMIAVLAFPAHVATATAQVILVFTALAGAITHFAHGDVNLAYAIPLAIGGVVGVALGAALARRLDARILKAVIAISMLAVAVRLIISV